MGMYGPRTGQALGTIASRAFTFVGYADRTRLAARLNGLPSGNHNLAIQNLLDSGVIKGGKLASYCTATGTMLSGLELAEIRPEMLSRTITREDLLGSNIPALDCEDLFEGELSLARYLRPRISTAWSASRFYLNKTKEAAYDLSLSSLATVSSSSLFYALWQNNKPWFAATAVLAGASLACFFSDKLTAFGRTQAVLDYLSAKLLPVSVLINCGFLTASVFNSNMSLYNMLNSTGIYGELGLLSGLTLLGMGYIRNNLSALERAHSGRIDPPGLLHEKIRTAIASGSVLADSSYLTVRALFLAASGGYLVQNLLASDQPYIGLAALSVPAAASLLRLLLFKSAKASLILRSFGIGNAAIDHLKCYLSLYGLGTGLLLSQSGLLSSPGYLAGLASTAALSAAAGYGAGKLNMTGDGKAWKNLMLQHLRGSAPLYGAAAGIAGSFSTGLFNLDEMMLPIAYLTFWGSLLTFVFGDSHGISHSINTTANFISGLRCSGRDLIGQLEARGLSSERSIMVLNPHTGTAEHTCGLTFSHLLSRKPKLSFVICFDRNPEEISDKGEFPREKDAEKDREFGSWVNQLVRDISNRLKQGLTGSSSLREKYGIFIRNLQLLAGHFESDLFGRVRRQLKEQKWAENHIEELLRACSSELLVRAQEFRLLADRLQKDLEQDRISEDSFYLEWSYLMGCYDPDLGKDIFLMRKALAGDDKITRKVENVATVPFFRGITVYKGWYLESGFENAAHPTEDWICGAWTRINNPKFRYDAASGMERSKYVWVKMDRVLTDLQRKYGHCLSTSQIIEQADNDPEDQAGFVKGSAPLTVRLNEEETELDEYYWVGSHDQLAVPAVKSLRYRDGSLVKASDLPEGFNMATVALEVPKTVETSVFTVPAFDYALMMDKNDVQLSSYLVEPAVLEKEAARTFLDLINIYRFGNDIKFTDPHPASRVKNVSVIDGNVEFMFNGRIMPVKRDRSSLHIGLTPEIKGFWQTLDHATLKMEKGKAAGLVLFYKKNDGAFVRVETKPSFYGGLAVSALDVPPDGEFKLEVNNFTAPDQPRTEGAMCFLKLDYEDGKTYFVRTGKRPHLMKFGEL